MCTTTPTFLPPAALAGIVLAASWAEAAPVAITNPGFEDAKSLTSWAGGSWDPGESVFEIPGWTDLGGNPGSGAVDAAEYPGGIPDGDIYAWFNQASDILSQTLFDTLQPETTYTLTVATGWRADLAVSYPTYPGYGIELWAGGVLLASDHDTGNGGTGTGPAAGTWKNVTARFATGPSVTPGQQLEIRLRGYGVQTNYDSVRLDATPGDLGIDGIRLSDTEITVTPAAGNPVSGHLVALEFGDHYDGARGWAVTPGTGGAVNLDTDGAMHLGFIPPAGGFGPVLVNGEAINADAVRHVSLRARVTGFTAAATVPVRFSGPAGSLDTVLPADGGWHIVRADLGSIGGWSGSQTLSITLGSGGDYADYQNALVELDWVAVNDAADYSGGLDYTRFDRFWDLGFPAPVFSGDLTQPIVIDRFDGSVDRMFRRFQLVDSNRNPLGGTHYVDDWSGLGYEVDGLNRRHPLPDPPSINGVDDYQSADFAILKPGCGKLNVVMASHIDSSPNPAFTWEADGIPVGLIKGNFDNLVGKIKALNDMGMSMYLVLLNTGSNTTPTTDNPLLPATATNGGTWIGHNTFDPLGRIYVRAFLEYLSYRLSGAGQGAVTGYIVGNEVDAHPVWHQVGPLGEAEFIAYHASLLRLADLSVRKHHPHARVLASLTHFWTTKHTIAPKTLLEDTNTLTRAEGDFPWGVAYHPYPQNLFEPDWWNDGNTSMDFSTGLVTYRNIEVLPQFLAQKAFRYRGRERHLAFTEQGFHTPTQAEQAAAYAYAYRKMLRMPQLKAHILHRHQDHPNEGGLLLGLRDLSGNPKEIYELFRNADEPDWQTSFDPYLASLPISSWDQAVPTWGSFNFHFDEDGFAEGWLAQNQVTGLAVGGGVISGTGTGIDPQLQMESFFASSDAAPRLLVRMRVATPESPKFYWKRDIDPGLSEARSFAFDAVGANEFHIYEIDAAAHPDWPGQVINVFRFDPLTTSGGFEIDYILGGQPLDFDADGIPDSVEGDATVDSDGDRIPDFADPDSDGDGIADVVEGADDVDGDGFANYRDPDSDGDGNPDADERLAGSAIYDLDDDNDGLANMLELAGDADGDGIANVNDPDSDGDGMDDGAEAASGRNPWTPTDLAFNFEVTGDFEGWDESENVSGISVTGGSLTGTTSTSDPQVKRYDLFLDGNTVTGVAVRLKAASAGSVELFWGREGADFFAPQRRLGVTYPGANQWSVIRFDASSHPEWSGEKITRLRIDPIGANGAAFEIDFIRHLDADLDDDGIDDATEGTGDTDGDGLPDYLDPDSDNDGIPDATEGAVDSDGDGLADFRDPDSDNDGQSDADENVAGTSPTDPAERFVIDAIQAPPAGTVEVSVAGKAGRTYRLLQAPTPNAATWTGVDSLGPLPGDAPVILVDPSPVAGSRFYRVEVRS